MIQARHSGEMICTKLVKLFATGLRTLRDFDVTQPAWGDAKFLDVGFWRRKRTQGSCSWIWSSDMANLVRIGAGELVGLAQVLAPAFERLLTDHGAPVAFNRGIVRGDELCGDHSFNFVCRFDPD